MAKVLLVEDDNNLREIYEARLQAEGYVIISAKDGEEALVAAKAEKPDLIISDVMMPKISGFEMLDILRNTPEIQATKVIMLTALGQTEDQSRADKLGADRYLVKSQVTLEDIVKASHELLDDSPVAPQPTPVVTATPPVAPQPTPVTQQVPINIEQTTHEIEQNLTQTENQENTVMQNQINDFLNTPNAKLFDALFDSSWTPYAGRIHDFNFPTVIFNDFMIDISGSASPGCYKSLLFIQDGIKKARFTDVWST